MDKSKLKEKIKNTLLKKAEEKQTKDNDSIKNVIPDKKKSANKVAFKLENGDFPEDQVSSIPKQEKKINFSEKLRKRRQNLELNNDAGENGRKTSDTSIHTKKFGIIKSDEKLYYDNNGNKLSEREMAIQSFLNKTYGKSDEEDDKLSKKIHGKGLSVIKKINEEKFIKEVKEKEIGSMSPLKKPLDNGNNRRESYKSFNSINSKILDEQKQKYKNEKKKKLNSLQNNEIDFENIINFEILENKSFREFEVENVEEIEILNESLEVNNTTEYVERFNILQSPEQKIQEFDDLTLENIENFDIFEDRENENIKEFEDLTFDNIENFDIIKDEDESSLREFEDITLENIENFDIIQNKEIKKTGRFYLDRQDFFEFINFKIKPQLKAKSIFFKIIQNDLNEENKKIYKKINQVPLKIEKNRFELINMNKEKGVRNGMNLAIPSNDRSDESQRPSLKKKGLKDLQDLMKITDFEERLNQIEANLNGSKLKLKNENEDLAQSLLNIIRTFNIKLDEQLKNNKSQPPEKLKFENEINNLKSINEEYKKIIKKLELKSIDLIHESTISKEKQKEFKLDYDYLKEKYDHVFSEYEKIRDENLSLKEKMENNNKSNLEVKSMILKIAEVRNILNNVFSMNSDKFNENERKIIESVQSDHKLDAFMKLNQKSEKSLQFKTINPLENNKFYSAMKHSKSGFLDKEDYFEDFEKRKIQRENLKSFRLNIGKELVRNSSNISLKNDNFIENKDDSFRNGNSSNRFNKSAIKIKDNKEIFYVHNTNKLEFKLPTNFKKKF